MCIFCIKVEAMDKGDIHTVAVCDDIIMTACAGIARSLLDDGEVGEKGKGVIIGLFNQPVMEQVIEKWEISHVGSIH